MNKQALAFISMFTLVLMLSIYYVSLETLPNQSDETVNNITSVMAMMDEQNNEKKKSILLKLKEQLGLSETSEAKKKEILTQIETMNNDIKVEDKIVEALNTKQMKSVVSIEENIVHVNVFEIEKSEKKAEEIMFLVHPFVKENQTIELIFS